MRALDRKILRDLRSMWSQALAVVLVAAVGTAAFVMSLGTLHSLERTQAAYYERYRFAEVFASVRRAPESLADKLQGIPGVAKVSTRIVYNVVLDIPGMAEPANGLLSSLPQASDLGQLHVRRGRLAMPGSTREAVLSESFADAHGLSPGSVFTATIKGHRRQLSVVGVALSPEYVFFGVPGAMVPDDERFGVLWMDREALEAAFDLEGAFNDAVMSLQPHASLAEIRDRVDTLLRPYGGVGAYGRDDHISHATLSGEIDQLRASIRIAAPIFIGVVAFLLHMLMMRHIEIERELIGAMKALGYGSAAVAWHYAKLVLAIVGTGVLLGLIVGARSGQAITEIYAAHYRFAFLVYELAPGVLLKAAGVQGAAALLGAMGSLWGAIRLPPAVAMRSPPPPVYRRTWIERWLWSLVKAQTSRMIVRHMVRWPARSTMTVLGIAAATSILIAPLGVLDSAEEMIDTHFFRAERQDMTVAFAQARPHRSVYEIARYPGVMQAEAFRSTPAIVRSGARARRVTVIAREGLNELARPLDKRLAPIAIPEYGAIVSSAMAHWLRVRPGDRVRLELLETDRPAQDLPIAGIAESYVGLTFFMVFMDRGLLNRLMREGDAVSGMHLRLDPNQASALYDKLKNTPAVTGAVAHGASLAGMRRIVGHNLRLTMVNIAVAATIVFGVVYNSARISLAERARELASMRLLGYSRLDVAYVLLGELALLALAAIPLGCALGYGFAYMLTEGASNELFRLPLHIGVGSFGYSVLVVAATVALTGAAVARQVFRLDIVATLKTKE